MRQLAVASLILGALACGKSGSNPSNPAAPTAPPPPGCSGNAVRNVRIGFSTSPSGDGVNFQLFGEAFNQASIPPNTTFNVERSVVPCTYEITGQMLGRSLQITFSRGDGIDSGDNGGVERGSIVVDQGPNPTLSTSQGCSVRLSAPGGSGLDPPLPFRVRFRVSTTNGYAARNTNGCS